MASLEEWCVCVCLLYPPIYFWPLHTGTLCLVTCFTLPPYLITTAICHTEYPQISLLSSCLFPLFCNSLEWIRDICVTFSLKLSNEAHQWTHSWRQDGSSPFKTCPPKDKWLRLPNSTNWLELYCQFIRKMFCLKYIWQREDYWGFIWPEPSQTCWVRKNFRLK